MRLKSCRPVNGVVHRSVELLIRVPDDGLEHAQLQLLMARGLVQLRSCRPVDSVVHGSVELLIRVPDNGVEHARWQRLMARGVCSWNAVGLSTALCLAAWSCRFACLTMESSTHDGNC